jgi:hypothetical protein
VSPFDDQLEKAGFIAALDQSGGSTPKALQQYGIPKDAWSGDDEMFVLVHEMRTRIVTSPATHGPRRTPVWRATTRWSPASRGRSSRGLSLSSLPKSSTALWTARSRVSSRPR